MQNVAKNLPGPSNIGVWIKLVHHLLVSEAMDGWIHRKRHSSSRAWMKCIRRLPRPSAVAAAIQTERPTRDGGDGGAPGPAGRSLPSNSGSPFAFNLPKVQLLKLMGIGPSTSVHVKSITALATPLWIAQPSLDHLPLHSARKICVLVASAAVGGGGQIIHRFFDVVAAAWAINRSLVQGSLIPRFLLPRTRMTRQVLRACATTHCWWSCIDWHDSELWSSSLNSEFEPKFVAGRLPLLLWLLC